MQVPIKIAIDSGDKKLIPTYSYKDDAGCDVCCNDDLVIIEPGTRETIHTGVYVEIPEGWQIEVRSRSGLAKKKGISVLNSPGTIDSKYRGEICVILQNDSTDVFEARRYDKIAQLVLMPKFEMVFTQVSREQLSVTDRGENGFGSTGIKK